MGYDLRSLSEVDSTMSEASRVLDELAGPCWILAKKQTAARGRRGRVWSMPLGNFSASLVLPQAGSPADMGLRSFVASLALYDTVSAVAPQAQLALKWPNDVLLNGGKMAGILLETSGDVLIVGIGVNLAHAPVVSDVEVGAVRPVSIMGETGIAMSPDDFMIHLAAAFAIWEERFRTYGFAPIREAWLTKAARLGEVIRARTMREDIYGTFETVDAQGHLVLTSADGRVSIPAADVFF